MAGFEHYRQKEIDSWIQDQVTPPFHRYFMTEDKTDITLTVAASKDDTVLNVSAGHGFTGTGEYLLINYGTYTQQSEVSSVATNAITIAAPIGIDLPISGTQIIRGSIEMNIDGTTPVTFYCRTGSNSSPVDIQHLHVFMRDASDGDQSTYGGLAALTKGTFFRYEDGVCQNMGIYRNNQDFVEFGATSNYNDKAPSGEYSTDFGIDVKDAYGIVFRLDPRENGVIKIVIQDNLTGLTHHRVVASGQITLNE